MSYIQIEIGGKLRGLKFNQGALMLMNEKQPEGTLSFTSCAMIYAGLFTNCYVKSVEFVDKDGDKETPITFEMVCDWVEELEESTIIDVMTCFQQINAFKKTLKKEEPESEEDKKKLEATTEPIVTESPVDT